MAPPALDLSSGRTDFEVRYTLQAFLVKPETGIRHGIRLEHVYLETDLEDHAYRKNVKSIYSILENDAYWYYTEISSNLNVRFWRKVLYNQEREAEEHFQWTLRAITAYLTSDAKKISEYYDVSITLTVYSPVPHYLSDPLLVSSHMRGVTHVLQEDIQIRFGPTADEDRTMLKRYIPAQEPYVFWEASLRPWDDSEIPPPYNEDLVE